MQASNKFIASESWKQLLVEADPKRRALMQLSLVTILKRSDLEDLLCLAQKGNEREQEAALHFFYQLCNNSDARLTAPLRERLAPVTRARMCNEYPLTSSGRLSLTILRYIHKQDADVFLDALPLESVPVEHFDRYLVDLSLGTPQSVERLCEIQRTMPEWFDWIERQLQRAGQMGARRVTSLADEWRISKSFRTLQKVRNTYLAGARNLPIRTILELLGEPDIQNGHRYTYYAYTNGKRTGLLYLEADADGRLVTEKIEEHT